MLNTPFNFPFTCCFNQLTAFGLHPPPSMMIMVSKLSRITERPLPSGECVACGHKTNADFNAALNVLRVGHVQLACGDIKRVAA